jgi:broad specificity phosphatase PhoE
MSKKTFDIHPFGTDTTGLEDHPHTKIVHFVRHAEGTHNVKQDYAHPDHLDARLTTKGKQQCQALAERIANADALQDPELYQLRENTDLIVTSPLTRCIETALYSFGPLLSSSSPSNITPPLKMIAHDAIRETVNYSCDRRRTLTEIQQDHPSVDYTHCASDHDDIWTKYVEQLGCEKTYPHHRESGELHVVAERGRDFFAWLERRPERHVVVCSHSAFMRCLWNFGNNEGGVPMAPPQNVSPAPAQALHVPVVRYKSANDTAFATCMRKDYKNCELRSMVVAFGS